MIPAGTHVAKFVEAEYWESPEKKTPAIKIKFDVGGEVVEWKGWLNSPENAERTQETVIIALGYTGDDSIDDNSLFKADAFPKKEVSLVIQHETFTDRRGDSTTKATVQWLNSIEGAQKFAKIEPQTVRAKIAALGLRNSYAAAKAKLNGGKPVSTKLPVDEVPF